MASQYETSATQMVISRQRGPEGAWLQGSVRPSFLPNPVAVCEGPNYITGPTAGAVGANEQWVCGVEVPATEVVWVMVASNYSMWTKTGVTVPASSYLHPYGHVTNGASSQTPTLGLGSNLTLVTAAASAGTYVDLVAPDDPDYSIPWLPLDPEWTVGGFPLVFYTTAPAGGLAVADVLIRMKSIRFLGYPITAWGTGVFHEPAASRGS